MFFGCSNLISLDLSYFDTSNVVDMSSIFQSCTALNFINLSNFNTSKVINMDSMFKECSNITSLDLSNFDTSNVENMHSMFYECLNLNFLNLSSFNTSSVFGVSYMFCKCIGLTSLDLSTFNTSRVSTMNSMFYRCSSLNSLDLSNFNTSNVTNMNYMFSHFKFKHINLSNFDTSKVENMAGMFSYSKFKSLDLSNFNTSQVKNMSFMFRNMELSSLNLSNFDTSKVIDISNMFYKCSSLILLDLSNFDTSKVLNMSRLFYKCSKLKVLNISNINTSNVIDMNSMFQQCLIINTLNLSNFDTSKVTNMSCMFQGCSDLISIDLSNFDTSQVKNMNYMFHNCSSIKSLNISNFDTSKVTNMSGIFYGCSNLTSLDLLNFNTSNANDMNNLFYNCKSLISLNLLNFDTSKVINMSNMFYNCIKLSFVNISSFDTSNVIDMNHMFYKCSLINSLDLSNFNLTEVKNLNNMFQYCKNLEYINLYISNINPYSYKEDIFLFTADNLIICFDKDDYKFINILQESKKYQCYNSYNENKYTCYLKNSYLYNKHICDICERRLKRNNNELNSSNIKAICYVSEGDFYNQTNFIEDSLYNYKNTDIYSTKYSSEIIFDFMTNEIIKINNKDETIQKAIDNLFKELNMVEINKGEDLKINNKNKTIILTSTTNQKNNDEKNYISMDLGKCEIILKNHYNISNNDSLYILQIISEEDGMKIPKIEYEVYYPLYNSNNLTKLNLSLCKNTKIEISISVKINGSIDKYDPKSDYYNDICSKATSDSGTDISLKDRKNEFVNNNMSLCEENCELIEYNQKKEKVKCSCDIKLNIPQDYDIKFNKNDFFKSFIDLENIININIMKCYKTVLKIKSLIDNYGFFIVDSVIIFYFISLFIFINYSYSKIKKEIYNIILSLGIHGNPIKKERKKRKTKNKKRKMNKFIEKNELNIYNNKNYSVKVDELKQKKFENRKEQFDNDISYSYNKMNPKQNNIIINQLKKYNNEIILKKDFELNSLDYEEAFKFDHRNFYQYYLSLLKNKHPIIFSFGSYIDYNSRIIKMFLFFFSFILDLAINALFFTDDTMHKIYQDKGKFNFLYQIPQILYSTLISRFIDSIIRNFALTQDNIVEFKQHKEKKDLNKKYQTLLRTLKIKFILFFVLAFMLLIFLSYYVTCFCGIYVNNQIHLIKDSLISLLISLLIPFVIYLLPGIFRISSLRLIKPNRKFLYKFSLYIENWFC